MDTIGKKLGLKEKMAYGCGDAASNIIWASTGTFLMFYYTDVVNINAATIGVIFLIARVINAVVALLTGWLIDNTHSKYGKARPWLWCATRQVDKLNNENFFFPGTVYVPGCLCNAF